jgi:hypothetical protein
MDAGAVDALATIAALPDPYVPEKARARSMRCARLLTARRAHLTRPVQSRIGECDHRESPGRRGEPRPRTAVRRRWRSGSGPADPHLVDEFQDTSRDQYELLRTLTQDWSAGDGRTLFLVGDPMQSIYGFRNAEVGRFSTVRASRTRGPSLRPLELKQISARRRPGALVQRDLFTCVPRHR